MFVGLPCFLRTPSFVCPIEKRVQGSLFFIKTIKTGRNGTVRYGTVRFRWSFLRQTKDERKSQEYDAMVQNNRMSTITTRQHEGPRNNATDIANNQTPFEIPTNN